MVITCSSEDARSAGPDACWRLHPDRLPAFHLDGKRWSSPSHFVLAHQLQAPEDRERVRQLYDLAEARALAATLPRTPDAAERELELLCVGVRRSLEANLPLRSLLLASGSEPIEARLGADPRRGVGEDGRGENLIGRALMTVREQVRARAEDPSAIQCEHQDAEELERVCVHQLEFAPDLEERFHRRYTGEGARFERLCGACGRLPPDARPMRILCHACFRGLPMSGRLADLGTPAILERESALRFVHQTCAAPAKTIAFAPIPKQPHTWLFLDAAGRFHRVDLARGTCEAGGALPEGAVELAKHVLLAVSPGGELAAVGESYAQRGVVVEPASGRVTLSLERGDYHVENCRFPLGFVEHRGRLLLIHATDWNRLDATDPRTGERLTARDTEEGPALDYFHSELHLSPGGTFALSNGWVWHPVGMPRVFSVARWLEENRGESEDGPSVRTLAMRAYYWDGPVAWLDETTVAVWGGGDDEEVMIPEAMIFDARTGTELRSFLGPGEGFAAVGPYLVSFDRFAGTAVWDPATGERLLHDAALCPDAAHPTSRELISVEDGGVRVSRIQGG